MKSIQVFRSFMLSEEVPNHIKRYCRNLSDTQWSWFYWQMQEPMSFVTDFNHLLYILKWVLKYEFDDLSYAVFLQEVMNPECNLASLIKDEWWSILCERYQSQLNNDIMETQYYRVCESTIDAFDVDDSTIF